MWPISSMNQSLNYLGLTGIGLKQNPIERKIKRKEKNVSFEVNGHCQKRDGQWCVYEAKFFFH